MWPRERPVPTFLAIHPVDLPSLVALVKKVETKESNPQPPPCKGGASCRLVCPALPGLHQALALLSGVAVIATFSVTEPVTTIPPICPLWMIWNSVPTSAPAAIVVVDVLVATGRTTISLVRM
jgi:hypothetical protein